MYPSDQPPDAPLGSYSASALDINNAGQVLLSFNTFDVTATYIYKGGDYTRLPHNRFFTGLDINEQGWVLGLAGRYTRRPKLYMDGVFYDLNSRILRGEDRDWKILEVYAMNDFGQIIGRGTDGGFIATPVPEPHIYALMLTGLGLIGVVLRRRSGVWT